MAALTEADGKAKVKNDMACTVREEKFAKKLKKIGRKLFSKECLRFSESPSKILCVQNGGLGNDVCQEELLSLFTPYGEVDQIIMMPRKPYCFVCFCEEPSAVHVYNNVNGFVLKKGKETFLDVILYLFFVETVPEHVTKSCEKPPGLFIVENFVDEATEEKLLQLMSHEESLQNGSSMKHRRVKHYGYEFRYDINDVDIANPLPCKIPDLCLPIIDKARDLNLISHRPDQLTINQYQPGQGIPPHVDTVGAFEDGIMSLSLGSQVTMEFRHANGCHASVILPQRSLLVMTDESRYVWSHGITPRKSDVVPAAQGKGLTLQPRGIRTSFTFRKVIFDRENGAERKPNIWTLPQNDGEAKNLEKEHVHKVYEDIADHFSGTRYKAWPRVVEFLMDQPAHSLMVDVGCGNGKCLGINKAMFEIGCDYSTNLASICGQRGFETCVADVTCLPFRSNVFDMVLCIAVIHHMATRTRRKKAVSELIRVLQSGGKALVYVWAMEQHFNKEESKYIHSQRQKKMDFQNVVSDEDSVNNIDKGVRNSSPSNHSRSQTECEQDTEVVNSDSLSDSMINQPNGKYSNKCVAEAKPIKVHVNRTEFQEQDMLVPWQLKNKDKSTAADTQSSTFHRFYHVFKQGELEELCLSVPQCVVKQSYHDQGNWCVVLQKL